MTKLIVPEWPLPAGVAACSSTRIGGVSQGAWESLNLGAHCGDNLEHVEENRDVCLLRGTCRRNRSGWNRFTVTQC